MTVASIGIYAAGILVAAGLLFGGHYAFRPPRTLMRPPYTYVYGVGSCLLGMAVWCAIAGTWAVPLWYVAAVFAFGGLLVWALYHWDETTEKEHHLSDVIEENRRLREAEDERLRNIGGM